MKMLGNASAVLAGCLLLVSAQAEEHSLKAVMKHLGMEMHHISDGLLVADYEQVARAASTISGHGHLSKEDEARIASHLGKEMVQFQNADELVHHRALELAQAAKSRSATLTAQRYGELISGCVACHAQFQERLRTH